MSNDNKNEEFYQQIKSIPILEYAQYIGLTPVRKGKYFSLKEHDSIIISPEKNVFWRNSGIGNNSSGSIIDFAMNMNNYNSVYEALKELEAYSGISNKAPYKNYETYERVVDKSPVFLTLPPASDSMKNVFAYLIKTRAISSDIVQHFVNEKMLYQDLRGNCVFVALENKKPIFVCQRGTNTEKRFVADVKGSDYEKGFYIDNNSKKIIVTESVIDAMSIMTILKEKHYNPMKYSYMVLTGVAKEDALLNQVKERKIEDVIICLDSDEAGIEASKRILDKLSNIDHIKNICMPNGPMCKDWNEELVTHRNCIDDIDFTVYKKDVKMQNNNMDLQNKDIESFKHFFNVAKSNDSRWWDLAVAASRNISEKYKNSPIEARIIKELTNIMSEASSNEQNSTLDYSIYHLDLAEQGLIEDDVINVRLDLFCEKKDYERLIRETVRAYDNWFYEECRNSILIGEEYTADELCSFPIEDYIKLWLDAKNIKYLDVCGYSDEAEVDCEKKYETTTESAKELAKRDAAKQHTFFSGINSNFCL